ncbi:penicillin-binding protein 2 [Streptococcus ovuberis]|uniref:Penicillin-binding protein 2 n=2 Tax=Streptococcus ovuberis TaxID=1936207 RepID=A0A7X6MVT9_9STRE|nr:penicillin-binding protein 2 [Streptococcus ovuberis]
MQLVQTDFYQKKLATASQLTVTSASVRGQIYDSKGLPLVDNKSFQAVAFTRSNTMTAAQIKATANALVTLVDLEAVTLSDRDKIDYHLADPEVYAEVVNALPKEQRYDAAGNRLSEGRIYAHAVASVSAENLTYSSDEEKAVKLFNQMNAAANFETVTLHTKPLSASQIARIASQGDTLKGIAVKTAWQREVLPTSLASIIGNVSTEQAGLPQEEADYYLAQGYSLNDRVGTSYLEKQYEAYLQGRRELKAVHLDKYGNLESTSIESAGEKGKNIQLTIDLAFQDGVNKILEAYFRKELANGHTTYSEGIYAVALNPETGAVLAMSGYQHDVGTDKLKENALGTVTDVFVPGSVVKGATLSTAWQQGVLQGNQTLVDQPIVFADSAPITSWFTQFGNQSIDAIQALQYSSNTYMVQLALKLMKEDYTPNMILSTSHLTEAMMTLREGFGQYGLGVPTGIDLPVESQGIVPDQYSVGNYLTNSFGQFDNYTTMQLAQYVATIANGGHRMAPRLVKGIYDNTEEGGLGELIEPVPYALLNQVPLTGEQLALLQEGFYQVVHNPSGYTTGKTIGQGEAVPISAKTGTAETFVTTKEGEQKAAINSNVVAYAPSHNPQIAVAVVLPHSTDLETKTSHLVTRDIINLYHQLYPMN